jgi:hypothetical protein
MHAAIASLHAAGLGDIEWEHALDQRHGLRRLLASVRAVP